MRTTTSVKSSDIESVMQWFENGIQKGENGILVYPNLQTFRGICTQYVKDQLVVRQEEEQKEENEDNNDDYYQDNNGLRKNHRCQESYLSQPFMIQSTL